MLTTLAEELEIFALHKVLILYCYLNIQTCECVFYLACQWVASRPGRSFTERTPGQFAM